MLRVVLSCIYTEVGLPSYARVVESCFLLRKIIIYWFVCEGGIYAMAYSPPLLFWFPGANIVHMMRRMHNLTVLSNLTDRMVINNSCVLLYMQIMHSSTSVAEAHWISFLRRTRFYVWYTKFFLALNWYNILLFKIWTKPKSGYQYSFDLLRCREIELIKKMTFLWKCK